MHHLLVCSLLWGDQNLKCWSTFLQLSPICTISCEIPFLHGIAQAVWRTFCSVWLKQDVFLSSRVSPCVTPTRDVPLLIAPATAMLARGKLLWCPNGRYFNFLGPWLPLYLLCLHLLIVLVQQGPLGLTNSNRFECINEVLCREGRVMLLGF